MFNLILQGFVLAHCLLRGTLVQAHVVLTYPGWRGNNLARNATFPFGMQWLYPCGGLSVTTNRTYWPIDGGALALQPGWFKGHETALMYINIGLGEQPENYSWPITKFYLQGPTDDPYPGTICQPKLTLPEAVRSRVKSGDLATIQVVQAAKHGAGTFTCADIIFTDDPSKVPPVNEKNCFNSTGITASDVAILGARELPSACASLGLATTPANQATAATPSGDMWGWACDGNQRSSLSNSSGSISCPISTPSAGAGENSAQGFIGGVNGVVAVVSVVVAVVLLVGGLQ